MSNVKKFTAHSYIEAKDYHYTWVIKNFMLIREKSRGYVISPLFTTDEIEFQLIFEMKYFNSGNRSDFTQLYISSVSNLSRNLPCLYKLSIMKDDESVYTKTETYHINTSRYTETIFAIPNYELEKFISSTGTMVVSCELKVATGEEANSSRHEAADAESSRKNNYDWIFLQEELSDVTLKIRDEKEIPAHRLVLADASPIFRAMFRHEEAENKTKPVDLVDITYETAVEMLRYIYTGKFDKKDFTLAMDLLAAADKYQVKELKSECEQTISSNMTIINAREILRLSNVCNSEFLHKRSSDLMGIKLC